MKFEGGFVDSMFDADDELGIIFEDESGFTARYLTRKQVVELIDHFTKALEEDDEHIQTI